MNSDWNIRAHTAIAQGSLTNSKRVECLIKGITPTHVTHGQGAFVFTPDNKRYLDFICALGTNLFGYADPYIVSVIQKQLYRGWLFSLGSTLEVECAEIAKEVLPFSKTIRFLKSGTEACQAAIRVALAHDTTKTKVLSEGYHGWSDGFVGLTEPALGVNKVVSFESLKTLSQIDDKTSCVIIEPIMTELSNERIVWLKDLVEKCNKTNTLLIFDETITGMRWKNYTVSNDLGLRPDLIILGKAIASGMPLAILGIKEGIATDKQWFVSGSYHGEMLSMVAFKKTIELLKNQYHIADLWREGANFLEKFNEFWPDKIRIKGYPTRGVFEGDPLTKALLWQECVKAGILFGPSWFINFCHIPYLEGVLSTCKDIIIRIRNNQIKLEGEMPTTPFAQKVRAA